MVLTTTCSLMDAASEASVRAYPRSGMEIGVLADGQRTFAGYGNAGARERVMPDERTVFEIGSITKVFTATLLAALVLEGRVRLDEPIGDLLPDARGLPPEITPLRLITHTAGMPRLPPNLWRSLLRHPTNPYATYTEKTLAAYLRRYRPGTGNPTTFRAGKPGAPFAYSNLGVGLLGQALAHAAGMAYEEAIIHYVCDPLGLSETRVTLTPELRARLAAPRSMHGRRTSNWDLPSLAGAGGIRSTAADMLTFFAANLVAERSTDPVPLGEALRLAHQVRAEAAPFGQIGMAWIIQPLGEGQDQDDAERLYWHNGGTGGYTSWGGFVPARDSAIVVLVNHGPDTRRGWGRGRGLSMDEIGMRLAREVGREGGADH
jgi:CubicO group peptidase (beta-lactamase class C family)